MIDPLWLLLIGMIVVLGGILILRLHAFLALILGALIVGSLTTSAGLERYANQKQMTVKEKTALVESSVGERVAHGFGRTCTKIGILIAMASIIGKFLLESGAAERIVRSLVKWLGEQRTSYAFLSSGFLLGMPVFFDTVFYLMMPLGKAMGVRTGRNYGLYIMSIVAGATMTHSLVPPTPGPLFVAGALSVNLGLMIIGGIVVGLFTVSAGYLYALWANRKWPIPVRDTADTSAADLKSMTEKDEAILPPFWLSMLPIILPVILIAGGTFFKSLQKTQSSITTAPLWQSIAVLIDNVGNPNVALTISAGIALLTYAWWNRGSKMNITMFLQNALSSGGLIILITSAGGAFGGILQQTGIGYRIQELAASYHIAVLPLAFCVTAIVRTAQGSATVAMITAVGILGGLAGSGQLGFHPVYLALVIGCGSKLIPWMNDSGFWVICKMSGMTEAETLKTCSTMMTLMGIVGLFVIMILARLFPLV
ncbi:MAG: GntP family permease [Planctomycetes bacterium]|nr:GntP family permease [Planctomycetota bacterium]MBL7143456.1 GntP family permease [Phycisphaerae bacterium]